MTTHCLLCGIGLPEILAQTQTRPHLVASITSRLQRILPAIRNESETQTVRRERALVYSVYCKY